MLEKIHETVNLTIPQEWTNGTDFLHAGTSWRRCEGDWKSLGWWACSKNEFGQSGEAALKLTVFEEWMDEQME